MDSLLKALGLVLYIVLSPLMAAVEACILFIHLLNYVGVKLQYLKTKHKKQVTAFIKHHRNLIPWHLHKAG